MYALTPGADADLSGDYFLRLGARVSQGLQAAGYPYCRGQVMASDPRWCRSLPDWLATYDAWLRRAQPQDITDLSVFLDFRLVHGEAALVAEMQRHVHETLPGERGVQYQLARNALTFRPPVRLPGNIYLGGGAEQAGHIDLKDALQPMARLRRRLCCTPSSSTRCSASASRHSPSAGCCRRAAVRKSATPMTS